MAYFRCSQFDGSCRRYWVVKAVSFLMYTLSLMRGYDVTPASLAVTRYLHNWDSIFVEQQEIRDSLRLICQQARRESDSDIILLKFPSHAILLNLPVLCCSAFYILVQTDFIGRRHSFAWLVTARVAALSVWLLCSSISYLPSCRQKDEPNCTGTIDCSALLIGTFKIDWMILHFFGVIELEKIHEGLLCHMKHHR